MIKSDRNVIKSYISNKCCYSELHSSKNPEKSTSIHNTTVFNIDNNNKCFLSTKSSY